MKQFEYNANFNLKNDKGDKKLVTLKGRHIDELKVRCKMENIGWKILTLSFTKSFV